jgi:hypothetical protein
VGEVSYKGHRYPAEIIAHRVWLYHRLPLSFREVDELMLVRASWHCHTCDAVVSGPPHEHALHGTGRACGGADFDGQAATRRPRPPSSQPRVTSKRKKE